MTTSDGKTGHEHWNEATAGCDANKKQDFRRNGVHVCVLIGHFLDITFVSVHKTWREKKCCFVVIGFSSGIFVESASKMMVSSVMLFGESLNAIIIAVYKHNDKRPELYI